MAERLLGEATAEEIDRLASAAFEWDRRNKHHKGGPWTWHMIGSEGQENYRGLVRAVLAESDSLRVSPDPSSGQDPLELALAAFNAWYEEHIDSEHYDFREGIEAALAASRPERLPGAAGDAHQLTPGLWADTIRTHERWADKDAIEAIIHDWLCGCGRGQACDKRADCKEAADQIVGLAARVGESD